MKVAALDLGTNTFHLLIADIRNKQVEIIFQEQKHVKLGEDGINKGLITTEAFERGLSTMREFTKEINRHQSQKIRAVGTAAIRQANNGAEFIQKVKEETGIEIELIDGNREADLIYQGVKNAVQLDRYSLIMDIGGGSVEFILCDKETIAWKKSYFIGAARLMALFHHTDPISISEIDAIHLHLNNELADLKIACQKLKPGTLIGSAGAFETFAALIVKHGYNQLESPNQVGFSFDMTRFKNVANQIIRSTHTERALTKEILPVRVDMIVVATVLVNYVLEELEIKKMTFSAYALKEGLLFDLLNDVKRIK